MQFKHKNHLRNAYMLFIIYIGPIPGHYRTDLPIFRPVTDIYPIWAGDVFDGVFLCCPFSHEMSRMGLNWVSFYGFSFLLMLTRIICAVEKVVKVVIITNLEQKQKSA